ncbi:uncharacterized protein FPRO_02229 [Fusarium proliferatum ET1]|uniref:Uncharacterized protein n=1 Tax=Fusarium proliferatum (strain ET1) TaxID=1227346 RepID=A0A1L7VDK9_FUSPR|nr:uncharacterized protein FPRO_02229 [Fusarium proliferatum ET1]CZR37510.1 uncharacterized protein FPRO_02229 [Fusarium proliferatum ET1]
MDKDAHQTRHIAANLEHGADGSTTLHTSVQHEPLRHDEGKKVNKDVIANPAEVQDVGWDDDQIRPEDYAIDGIKNEDIWLLVRRFNKLNTIADVLTHSFEKPGSHTAPTALHLWSHPLKPSVVKT